MNALISLENQLLITKFYVPVTSGSLISRPRLIGLLNKSLKYPLTLVSAPAGFGKTTLLAAWTQSQPANHPQIAWVSLDEEDNEPRLFWTYVLTALNMVQPERFTPLLMHLQSPHPSPLKHIVRTLINTFAEATEQVVLILDDYHRITEQQVHTTLSYLVEHLPIQLRIILSTRTEPPFPLLPLQARQQLFAVHTHQLRCTAEETKAFFREVTAIQLPDEMLEHITTRTEGWLVGMQLLGLSLPDRIDYPTLLQQISGDQRYILDYLTEEVLQQQPQEVQTFLLCTSILKQLTAPLCDAVMQQADSQQMLQRLEQANLFVVSLDSKRVWYRYHTLFAQALRYRLEQAHADLVPMLHRRASLWYAEHDQTTQAILHALCAKEWDVAADLIERKHLSLTIFAWGVSEHELILLQDWLKQLPTAILHARPRLCTTSTLLLWQIAPHPILHAWLDAAEAGLIASLTSLEDEDRSPPMLSSQVRQHQEALGRVIVTRAHLRSYEEDGATAIALSQRALMLLPAHNLVTRAHACGTQLLAYYSSSANNAAAAIQSGLQAISIAQSTQQPSLAIYYMGATALQMIGTGQLHEAYQLSQQAIRLGRRSMEGILPDIGWPMAIRAEMVREWNQLDAALALAEEGISLYRQTASISWLALLLWEYSVLLRVCLSRGELEKARSAFQHIEEIGMRMNWHVCIDTHSRLATVDQVRLWLACGDLERATRWAEELDIRGHNSTPFARERKEVARVRILLATLEPTGALQRLEPVLQRAVAGQRWGHVIEIRMLQALAYQMCQQETQALDTLSEAVRLAEPEGYIRSFLDEGAPMEALLSHLRRRDRKSGPTPYLDTLLAAFQQESMLHVQAAKRTKAQPLSDPLSERELEVLQLLAQGASNQEIAQELVIAVDTVKRHTSHIFSKLGVHNRMQAVLQARELSLLGEEM